MSLRIYTCGTWRLWGQSCWVTTRLPSTHARSDSHPIQISWEALARSGLNDSCIPACLLTQSARTKLDPGWFCIILSRTSLEEWNQVWKSETRSGLAAFCHNRAQWFLHNGLFPDKTCLAKPWPGHPDQIWVSFAQYDPCLLWKNRTELDVGSWIRHIQPSLILAVSWP